MEGVGLSPAGQAEAAAAAEALVVALAGRPVAALVSSPLQRARETAAPIAARLGLEVAVEPGFAEVDFGDWTGARFEALHGQPAWRAFNTFRGFAPIPGGETMLAVQARAVDALLRLRGAWPDAELVVVSHADVVKAILAHLLGVSLDLFRRIEVGPASRSTVVLYDEDAAVECINLPPPMAG